ncbi:ABC transporter ATP-binding protein [Aureimonas mangrovi]|uniref:ABC transporter ATP-binding protein n=1 Tax=Aureimonas mangrovi TaxID=2758041 RepID=UPI001FE9CEF3|nr:ABC transporter ATP-binding protein [Aureimonas mangrovi]
MSSPALLARDLRMRFGPVEALSGVSIEIAPGRITAFCGANGSGKSTLLRCLCGLESGFEGEVRLGTLALGEISARDLARQIAVVGQNPLTPAGLLVHELVEQGRFPHRRWLSRRSDGDRAAVTRAMQAMDLEALAARPVEALSGGERQRAFIAMALAQEPRILFLDEPTSFLDLRHQAELLALLRRLNRRDGLTIVTVLHDLNQVMDFADAVVLMERGRILASGDPRDTLSAQRLGQAFGCKLDIVPHPVHGRPFCVVDWRGGEATEPLA